MSTESQSAVPDLAANKALIAEFFAAWEEGQFERMEKMLDPDGEWWTLASRKTRSMREQLDRNRALWGEASNGISFRLETFTAEEDRVAVVVESVATFDEQGGYNNLYHFLFRVEGGLIRQAWVYYDTALANRVLRGAGGGVPVPSHAKD